MKQEGRAAKMSAGCHPGFDRTGNSVIRSADDENHTLDWNQTWSGSDHPLRRYGHSNMPRWRPAAILKLFEPEMVSFDPTTPKTLP